MYSLQRTPSQAFLSYLGSGASRRKGEYATVVSGRLGSDYAIYARIFTAIDSFIA
jgi:hypothetical protein